MKKYAYLFKHAEAKGKITGILALVLAVAAIVLVVLSANAALNEPVTEINALKLFLSEDQLNSFDDQMEEELDFAQEAINNTDEAYLQEFENNFGISAKTFIRLMKNPSIKNLTKLFTAFNADPEVVQLFNVIIKVVTIYAAVLIGFLLLGAFFMRGGWAITSMILSVLFFIVFTGFAWLIAYAVICIAFSICSKIFRGAYRDYKVIEKYKAKTAAENATAAAE